MSKIKRGNKPFYVFLFEIISNISLAVMFIAVMAGVITRYVLRSPLFWTDELSRYLMIYMVFLGSMLALRENKHPSLTFFADMLHKKWRHILDVIVNVFTIFMLIMLTIGALSMMFSGPIGYTSSLRIKYTWVYLAIPIGTISMTFEAILKFFHKEQNESGQNIDITK